MPQYYAIFNHGLRKLKTLEKFLGAKIIRSFFFAPKNIDATLGWGRKKYSQRARKVAVSRGLKYYSLEDGFLRSIGLGPSEPPLSIVIDDIGIYYDATTSSRLEQLIKQALSPNQANRANIIINKWREARVSKYNHLREYNGKLPAKYVLVVDQTMGDDSISFGLATKKSFAHMLEAALSENPDTTIIIKTHPEVMAGRKRGHFDLTQLISNPRLQILGVNVHPVKLIEHAKTIYTVTSQIGFEGLLWGKKVRTFGMPFYAGWGLTQDELTAPTRRKNISLEHLVYAALVDYPRYIDPENGELCTPERLIEWIGLQRRMYERFPETVYAVGFSYWKKPILKGFFQGTSVKFTKYLDTIPEGSTIAVWGKKEVNILASGTHKADVNNNTNIICIEDGFLRSVGLGADLISPISWVMDNRGIYYDSKTISDLEYLLQTTQFTTEILSRAQELRKKIVRLKLTKYNVGEVPWQRPVGVNRIILVPGQVEGDASISFGSPVVKKNIDLLRTVRQVNPEAYIVYKPHPDVVAGLRAEGTDENKAVLWCNEIVTDSPIGEMLELIDEVHTITSLAGFEALIRGKKVITYGQPFYSGWGVTEDHYKITRRNSNLNLDELVAGALILYPTYLSQITQKFTTPEQVLDELSKWQRLNMKISWQRKLLRLLLCIIKKK
ncbi:MAG TPA: hypothetical protein QKA37_04890 [Candidatus Megaira endosymbiont of Stentor roeselii]|nr:hypothetical protein [Candidatus Megaera endosymbiont of Stentor roeselii]